MLLIIDNYDSFTFNLVQCVGARMPDLRVVRNDSVSVDDVAAMDPIAILISPGPGHPQGAGVSLELIRRFFGKTPILGVCLGHQCLAAAFDGSVSRARFPMHGRTSPADHDGSGLFAGLQSPTPVARYHSLAIDEAALPDRFRVAARADDGTVMGIANAEARAYGVQFHPESFMTPFGTQMIDNFLEMLQ